MRYLLFLPIALIMALPHTVDAKMTQRTSSCKDVEHIQIFDKDKTGYSYKVLGMIHVKSAGMKYMSCKIRRIAKKYGGDAVVNYSVGGGGTNLWTGGVTVLGQGIAVKRAKGGITRISENTPVPVLQ